MGRREVDAQQPVPIRPGAGAAAPRLDAEQVVEQRHDEVVVQVAAPVPDDEGDDRQPLGVVVAQDVDAGYASQRSMARPMNALLALADGRLAHLLLELEHEAGADRLDDVGRAGLLAMLEVGEVDVLAGVDVLRPCRRRGTPGPGS